MNVEDQRVELPPGPLDLVASAAERFRAAPDDLSAWLALKSAVDAARPNRTDPLAKAVSIILEQLEDGADPYTLAAAYGELDSRLNAVRPLDANSLINPYPPDFEWLVYSWLPWGRVALLAGDGGLGKSRLALRLASGIAAAEPDWLGRHLNRRGIQAAQPSSRPARTGRDCKLGGRPGRVRPASCGTGQARRHGGACQVRRHGGQGSSVGSVGKRACGEHRIAHTGRGEAQGVHREDRGRAARNRPPGGRIRRGRECPRPRQSLPLQLGRLGALVRVRRALRGTHPQKRSADLRQHRLAKCGPKRLDDGIPGTAEVRAISSHPGNMGCWCWSVRRQTTERLHSRSICPGPGE